MRSTRAGFVGFLLLALPLLGGDSKQCFDISASHDTDVHVAGGVRVTVKGSNRCSEEIQGYSVGFNVVAIDSANNVIGKQHGRFGGTVAPRGQVETKVVVLCDPDRVRSIQVKAD